MFQFALKTMMLRAAPRRTRTVVLPAITPPALLSRPLERTYMSVIRWWQHQFIHRVVPAYAAVHAQFYQPGQIVDSDATPVQRLNSILEALGDEATRMSMDLTVDLDDWTIYVDTWHRARWVASLQPHNVDLRTWIGPADTGGTLQTILRQNVSLIRNVSEAIRRASEQIIFEGFTQRKPARVIARQLSEATQLQRKRALRIVSDQTQRLSSLLDEERMRQAGLDEYQWQHSGKVHYRPHHLARDGKVFKWGEIPADDMPGIPPFCGCKKRAVITFD